MSENLKGKGSTKDKPDIVENSDSSTNDENSIDKSARMYSNTNTEYSFSEKCAPGLRITILILICCIAVGSRQFSVARYESLIHEYDPWFNYRTTEYLLENGYYKFKDWIDFSAWYPIGRITGRTLYPGLMMTAWIMHGLLHGLFLIPIHIREVCVFTAPIFSCLTAFATYGLACEVGGRTEAGLIAALLVSIMPTYMSRSVAGSYDNEAVAIFALVCAFYTYARSLRIGSLMSALIATVSYYYMVVTWGGYVFLLGFFSMYSVALVFLDRLDMKAYITFSVLYVVGNMLSLGIPFLQDYNAVWMSTEHVIAHLAFLIIQTYYCRQFLKKRISDSLFSRLSTILIYVIVIGAIGGVFTLNSLGKLGVGHRLVAIFNPTYSKKNSPLISSIDEHKSTPWSQLYSQIHYALFLCPLGALVLLSKRKNSNTALFGILYCLVSIYFASVMTRLKLVAGPGCAVLGGIGISYCISRLAGSVKAWIRGLVKSISRKPDTEKKNKLKYLPPVEVSIILILLAMWLLSRAVFHGAYESITGYSEPFIVMSWIFNNKRYYLDDFREGYSWIRQNTDPDTIVMSWWDTGYQLAGLGNRTTVNDNNTWNETHIGKVSYVRAY